MSPDHADNKVFVLDTSVILYDYRAIDSFEEHDVVLPITVLEELDQFKKGNSVINLHAREFMRRLDRLSEKHDLRHWAPLNGATRGCLSVVGEDRQDAGANVFGGRKNDHRILDVALKVARKEQGRPVTLVTKDINLRVKARSLGLKAEDYETVRIKDIEQLYTGRGELQIDDDSAIDRLYEQGGLPWAELLPEQPNANQFLLLRSSARSALAYHNPRNQLLETVSKVHAYGVAPRNAEQTFALHALLNPALPLVSITGPAGTGKTLLALAAALEQRRRYRQILLARPVVPMGNRDIGYLPGDVQSKIGPWMQPLWDNLGVIKAQYGERQKESRKIDELVEAEKLQIMPLAYIRGRSLANIVFVVDEAQNLTPHEIKTIITRAGEGTKIVFTGDIHQIDTPYLDAHSNGLSYLIDRMRGSALYAHVNLDKGERSELANLASKLL